MKQKIEAIGEGEGAVFTLGFYSDDLKVHYQSCSFPVNELPEGAEIDNLYDHIKVGRVPREPFNWLPTN